MNRNYVFISIPVATIWVVCLKHQHCAHRCRSRPWFESGSCFDGVAANFADFGQFCKWDIFKATYLQTHILMVLISSPSTLRPSSPPLPSSAVRNGGKFAWLCSHTEIRELPNSRKKCPTGHDRKSTQAVYSMNCIKVLNSNSMNFIRCLLSFIASSGIGDEGNTRLLGETIVR